MHDSRRGVFLVVIAMTIFSVQDVFIKLLSDDISLFQVLFCRSSIGVLLIAGYLRFTGQRLQLGTAYPLLSIIRGLLFFLGYSAFYFGQSKVPIANATVLFLVSPFFITILSIFAFGSLGNLRSSRRRSAFRFLALGNFPQFPCPTNSSN